MNKWTTQEMAQRLARDIEPGWYVNIGIGMPEMVCENLREDDDIREFYLGLRGDERGSLRDVKQYRRRKRWLS